MIRKVFSNGNGLIKGECDDQIGSHGRLYIYLSTGVLLTVRLSCQDFPIEGGEKGSQESGGRAPESGTRLTTFLFRATLSGSRESHPNKGIRKDTPRETQV